MRTFVVTAGILVASALAPAVASAGSAPPGCNGTTVVCGQEVTIPGGNGHNNFPENVQVLTVNPANCTGVDAQWLPGWSGQGPVWGPVQFFLSNSRFRMTTENMATTPVTGTPYVYCWQPRTPTVENAAFARPAIVQGADAGCVTTGAARGRVLVEARVRYGGVSRRVLPAVSGQTHTFEARIDVLDRAGRRVATATDRGSRRLRANAPAPTLHLHRVALSPAASRAALRAAGGDCEAGSRRLRLRVTAVESVSRTGSAREVGPRQIVARTVMTTLASTS